PAPRTGPIRRHAPLLPASGPSAPARHSSYGALTPGRYLTRAHGAGGRPAALAPSAHIGDPNMQARHIRRRQGGFTLVEMAVVLVIIGVIIGAVMIGRDVQRNAEYTRIKQKFVDQ